MDQKYFDYLKKISNEADKIEDSINRIYDIFNEINNDGNTPESFKYHISNAGEIERAVDEIGGDAEIIREGCRWVEKALQGKTRPVTTRVFK